MVTVTRGDVVLCRFDPVVGSEQAGTRPAIVVQMDKANTASPHTIVVPCTTRFRTTLLSSHVALEAGMGGLQQDSVVLCEQIRVIDRRRIVSIMGQFGRGRDAKDRSGTSHDIESRSEWLKSKFADLPSGGILERVDYE